MVHDLGGSDDASLPALLAKWMLLPEGAAKARPSVGMIRIIGALAMIFPITLLDLPSGIPGELHSTILR